MSKDNKDLVVGLDMGTSKIAVCERGEIVEMTAIDVGARTLSFDAEGKTAVVSGVFAQETLSLADAKHFAEDAGKDPATVTEPLTQYSIELAGVTFL